MEQLPSITVEGLTKTYGAIHAIRDVNFSIRHGEVVGFLGPNGAGKSTTLRILCGLLPATSGRATVCGVSLARDSKEVRKHIGYMAENNPLPEDMRVVEYLRFRGKLKGLRGRALRERTDEVLELCDLNRKARKRLIGALSKGYRQRVGIADAILAKPQVAILDEPTIGLDPHQVLLIRELLSQLRGHMTIIISSHILSEVEVSSDRAIIMNHGRVVAIGTPEELRKEFVREDVYYLQVAGDAPSIMDRLSQIDNSITTECGAQDGDGFYQLTLHSRTDTDFSEEFLKVVQSSPGHRVRSLYKRPATLEDVFLAATRRSFDTTSDATRTVISQAKAPAHTENQ